MIFISSSIPSREFPKVEFWGWSKMVHLFYYAVLCAVLRRVLLSQEKYPFLARHASASAVLFSMLYGGTDEFHQLFTPGRHAAVTDVLIDGFGALLFVLGDALGKWRKSSRSGPDAMP